MKLSARQMRQLAVIRARNQSDYISKSREFCEQLYPNSRALLAADDRAELLQIVDVLLNKIREQNCDDKM